MESQNYNSESYQYNVREELESEPFDQLLCCHFFLVFLSNYICRQNLLQYCRYIYIYTSFTMYLPLLANHPSLQVNEPRHRCHRHCAKSLKIAQFPLQQHLSLPPNAYNQKYLIRVTTFRDIIITTTINADLLLLDTTQTSTNNQRLLVLIF